MGKSSWFLNLLSGGFGPDDRSSLDLERTRMINIGLLTMIVIALPFTVQYLILGVPLVSVAVIATCIGAVTVMILVRRGVSLGVCGYLAGSITYVLLLVSNLNSGGFYDPNFAWFYVVPLVGAVLVDARAAWVWSLVVIATTIVFWSLDHAGVVIPDNIPDDLHPLQSLLNRLSALLALAVLIILFVRAHSRSRREAYRLAHFDELTELPNRRALMKRLNREIAQSDPERLCALFFIDLDRFKTVNDSLGHTAGDQLLCAIAEKIQATLAELDDGSFGSRFVARFGGDEFAIVVGNIRDRATAERIGNQVVKALEDPARIAGYQLHSGASVGIALSPTDGVTADELLRSADLAMYQAKDSGGMRIAFCNDDLRQASERWMEVDAGLREAVDAGELSLVFQPIVELKSREITAVEALLRWRREGGEVISPAEFIPVAEATGAILDIGEWVLGRAREAAEEIFSHCAKPIRMSVNLSAAQLRSPLLGELIAELVDHAPLPRGWLELELTESLLLEDYKRVTALMSELGEHGVEFAIDDFGTGYSSLSYVAGLPANRLKVDREFVTAAATGQRQREVTNAIFAMAERLNLPTVAEGIETKAAASLVESLGCSEGQGNYFSRPVGLDDLIALLGDPTLPSGSNQREQSTSQI